MLINKKFLVFAGTVIFCGTFAWIQLNSTDQYSPHQTDIDKTSTPIAPLPQSNNAISQENAVIIPVDATEDDFPIDALYMEDHQFNLFYGDLLAQLNLDLAKAEQLKQLLNIKHAQQMINIQSNYRLMELARLEMQNRADKHGISAEEIEQWNQESLAVQQKAQADLDEANSSIKQFLTEEQYQQFTHYEKTELERNHVSNLKQKLGYDFSLTPDEKEQLVNALYEKRKTIPEINRIVHHMMYSPQKVTPEMVQVFTQLNEQLEVLTEEKYREISGG